MKNKDIKYIKPKAVALKYDKEKQKAPNIVASGTNNVAKNIIKIAKENNIPIKKDEDLVELLSKLDIGEDIPPNMYEAVAEIFRFIYNITKK
jgi:flagellar biosynthesis protein